MAASVSASASSTSTAQVEGALKRLVAQLGVGQAYPLELPKPKLAPIDWNALEDVIKGSVIGHVVNQIQSTGG